MKTKLTVRAVAAVSAIVLICISLSSCKPRYEEFTSFTMGSVLNVKIYSDDKELSRSIREKTTDACEMVNKALSVTDKESEIYHLNQNKRLIASPYTIKTLMSIILVSNTLERKADVSVGEITKLWGFTGDTPHVPDKDELQKAVDARDIEKIEINEETSLISITSDISLDTGAFGKGAACDAVYEEIKYTYTPFIMSLGGNVMAYDKGPSSGKWVIGIRNPFASEDSYFATLSLAPSNTKNAVFVSTSGSYEKNFTENSETYHHIIDPRTGYPVKGDLVSVTVVSNSGLNADALATAVFVCGFGEDALAMLRNCSSQAVFIFSDNTYYVTDGLSESFSLTDKSFTLKSYEN